MAWWVGDEFPRIVPDAFRRQAHVVFVDESGFFLTPTVGHPCHHSQPVAARPNLYFAVYPHASHAEQVVPFLADRHRRLGPLTVVWDRGRFTTRRVWYGSGWPGSPGW